MAEADSVLEVLFPSSETVSGAIDNSVVSPKHAEQLLYDAPHANKYYNAFQSYNRQFVETSNNNGKSVVRWHNSAIERTQTRVFELWLRRRGLEEGSSDVPSSPESKSAARSALFAWSSGGASVPQSKTRNSIIQPLGLSSSSVKTAGGSISPAEDPVSFDLPKGLNLVTSKESITNRLHRMVDQESSRLLQERIQGIKEHHMEEMSKQISERRRKDHELHLLRLKQKEEEYEDQFYHTHEPAKAGFFGSLFGFSSLAQDKSEFSDDAHSIGDAFKSTGGKSPTSNSKKFSLLLWGHTDSKDSVSLKPKTLNSLDGDDGTPELRPSTPLSPLLNRNNSTKLSNVVENSINSSNGNSNSHAQENFPEEGENIVTETKIDISQHPQASSLTPQTPTWNMTALSPLSMTLSVLQPKRATPSPSRIKETPNTVFSGDSAVIFETENGNANDIPNDDDDDDDDDDDFDDFVSSNVL